LPLDPLAPRSPGMIGALAVPLELTGLRPSPTRHALSSPAYCPAMAWIRSWRCEWDRNDQRYGASRYQA